MFVVVPMPLPVRAMVAGLLLALPVRVTLPVRVPDEVGLKVTVTVQEAPTASDEQLLVCAKSPVAATEEMVAVVVPVLLTLTVCAALVEPTIVPANDRLDGPADRIGPGATPLPDSGIVLVMPDAVTVRLPVRAPVAVGVNLTLTVQEPPAAIELPHVLVCAKSPVMATPVTGAAAVPELVIVTVWAALVDPVATAPKPSVVGLIEISEPLSGRYGGKAGLVTWVQAVDPKIPELPPPSVSVKPTPQL